MVSTPTGPPPNLLIKLFKYSKSTWSKPYLSTFNLFKALLVISISILNAIIDFYGNLWYNNRELIMFCLKQNYKSIF